MCFGHRSLDLNIGLNTQTCFAVLNEMLLLPGKEYNGRLKQPLWVTNGWLAMGKESGFGRTSGSGTRVWMSSFGIYMSSTMSKVLPLIKFGMEPI